MRQKRAKSYKKQMSVYTNTFKFRTPYQVLLDPELLVTTHTQSFDILKGLQRTLQDECKPMITQCSMAALYATQNQALIDFAKTFERRRCNHRETIPASECIALVVDVAGENKHRYVVGSQDGALRKKLRGVPGVPLVYMNRAVMVLESLSEASKGYNEKVERLKLTAGLNSKDAGKVDEKKDGEGEGGEVEGEGEVKKGKKRKGPKEPNPLSVKKKKKVVLGNGELLEENKKKKKPNRRRKHKKSGDGEVEKTEGEEKSD
ncbi:rRNA-processing protein UTP23 [Candida viswanathii]|uniref:U three protein 23 n=1 Tax=Candida viswanathii TaxID=5486 RepID=A0A367Y9R0_9ASCO|nr:rRNA-processing protein UTP23 [Candida viswanathii]